MKVRLLKVKHWFLLSLMGVMGVMSSSCEKYGCPEPEYEDMYGCPETEFDDPITDE